MLKEDFYVTRAYKTPPPLNKLVDFKLDSSQ